MCSEKDLEASFLWVVPTVEPEEVAEDEVP